MKYLIAACLQLLSTAALARGEHDSDDLKHAGPITDPFLKEYAWGVRRLPMDGGKMYGWKLNDRLTFGRFKGESDQFGFGVELDTDQRLEITTDGFRWRKAIGGAR
jgi:hypothetical protein